MLLLIRREKELGPKDHDPLRVCWGLFGYLGGPLAQEKRKKAPKKKEEMLKPTSLKILWID